jgi:hypothetical protein
MFSAIDIFLTDSSIELLISYPAKIGNIKSDTELLTDVSTLTSAIKYHAEKKINELSYKKPIEFLREVYAFFGEDLNKENPYIGLFVEGKATRDLFMHNGGKPNFIYFEKAGKFARNLKEDQEIKIEDDYLKNVSNAIDHITDDILCRCFVKHKDDIPPKIFQKMWEMSSLNEIVPFEKQWRYSEHTLFGPGIIIEDFHHPWSHSEQALFNFFRQIHSGSGAQTDQLTPQDIPYALMRWRGRPDERIIQSWLEAPFYL